MSLRHAILGFLGVAAMSGYDLRKTMDASVAHFWPADQTQIYRTLSSLVDDGLVDVRVVEQDGKPNRREHHIRPEGLAELDRWLASPMGYQPSREPFLLRVFFGGRLGAEHVARLLDERGAEAAELVAILREVERQSTAGLDRELTLEERLRLATLANGIRHAEAELDWVDETRRTLTEDS
ncbi:PadR family transcriptional regulator [Cellulomonas fimi]|uniref:PadR family transcriptional regulator n=1 Tax=Cellulomonas fimi TaxID=1708 RepID=A0A7Y0LWH6_CELFI|nr:PadR family transcriptional regulator [Cellulomonas fimi]NMR18658.1 PadR family transcriptional regulator [Cellulomonas fimi]